MNTPPEFDLPPFPGFRERGITFLGDLKLNNDRDWFKARKATYDDELVWPMQCLVAELSTAATRLQIPLGADPTTAIFRIYRDIRFSKDKRPYKTHIGAVLTRSGHRKEPGGLYIHVEPGQSFITGGYWRPESRLLQAWRRQIEAFPDRFLEIARQLEASGLTFDSDDKLKRLPRGATLDPEQPAATYLRWKSFLGTRHVTDDELLDPSFVEVGIETMLATAPLLEFGRQVEEMKSAAAPQNQ